MGTGVKIYNWMFTMYAGRIRFTTPMLWSLGFLVTFTVGGMTAAARKSRLPIFRSTTACSSSPTSTTSSSAACCSGRLPA